MVRQNSAQMDYSEAMAHAVGQAMEADEQVFVYGEGINDPGAYLGSTAGLSARFGTRRCFDVPNCEDALVGLGVGTALMGYRPLLVSLRVDFLMLAMNQIINHAARWPAMTGYQTAVPLTIRALIGKSWGQAAQHSGSLYSMFANVPGLEVVLPSSPLEGAGLVLSALCSPLTTLVIEERGIFDAQQRVPRLIEPIPFGQANTVRSGRDITLVAVSSMVRFAAEVADRVAADGVEAEVIDLRTVRPLDEGTIRESVRRTGSVAVFDIGWPSFGLGAEVSRVILESGGLRRPLLNIHRKDEHTPSSVFLEYGHYPIVEDVVAQVKRLLA